ncbi:MAG TPA: DNA internalization-related competence protein ComEC/Rec2 [Marmoricola sp.]|nr:DNA internalization-related competence protein ComEC/Rec2 [Marmoricola sp.]
MTAAEVVSDGSGSRGHDLRAPLLALVVWVAALVAHVSAPGPLLATGGGAAAVLVLARRRGRDILAPLSWLVAATAVVGSVELHAAAVRDSPTVALARERATVSAVLTVRSDPVRRTGRFGSYTLFRGELESLTGRGARYRLRAPVLVMADAGWQRLALGTRLRTSGRLAPARGADLAGLLATRGPPDVLDRPGPALQAAAAVRGGIRAAVSGQPSGPRALVPALVDGDDTAMPEDLAADFRATGLTHLLAVSGTNLTLVVGFLLILARWVGVRARGLVVVGALGVAGFVLLARTEPSVVRAAAMGTVALLGMGSHGRERGTRGLGVAVVVLLLADPALAWSPGFALSACATAGILFLGPPWRDALRRWLPRWAAEAVAVPLAAQLACTPLVAAISGQVSLVAVLANLLAAPPVGPATVLGLLGGLAATVSPGLGRLVAAPAGWCATWIIAVARLTARLPEAAVGWPTSPAALAVLTAGSAFAALVLAWVLARRGLTLTGCAVLAVCVLVPMPTPGWPPTGWVMVACDVGQGDGLVLNSGHGAVVVDAGPDPAAMQRCLDTLGVHRVPLVVLTHFHADHVDGLPAVLDGREVGAIEVSPYADPLGGVRLVRALAARADVPVHIAAYGETRSLGALRWQVLAPSEPPPASSDSPPNDASVVMLVRTRGISILMMGDEEVPSQERLAELYPQLHADVLKVAHHGSASQDPDLVRGLGARVGLISVGRNNDYGHPAPSTLALLSAAHLLVRRTDESGDVAVVVSGGGLRVVDHRVVGGP